MKKSSNNDKKFDNSKINIDTIISFCKNNVRYVSAGVLMVVLVVVLAVTAVNSGKTEDKKADKKQEQTTAAGNEYEVNENKELNELINKYYKLYAAGEVDKLAKIASPVSDMEKSYIKMMSKYVESYNEVDCYTKKGLDDNSYMVSATYEMQIKKAEGTVPGMDFFYVRTNKDGKLYIDNLYSSFNMEMNELETDEKVTALIGKFKEDSDVRDLQSDFQNRYTKTVSENKKLQERVTKVTDGIKKWADSYVAEEKQVEEEAAKKKEEEAKKKEEEAKKKEEEAKKKEEEAKKKEEEAKKKEEAAKKKEEQKNNEEQPKENGGINYIAAETTLTTTDAYNVRKSMSETSDIVGTTAIGDNIKVILSYEEGWTKVEWNGKKGYIKTELLLNN